MFKYIGQRIIAMLITFFLIITLSFFIIRLMPQNIFDHPDVPPDVRIILEEKMHLNEPISVQYYYYLRGVILEGDFGTSVMIRPGKPVFDVIAEQIPITMLLNVLSLFISLPLGILFGMLAALKRNKLADHAISFGVVICISVPSFVFASLMQYVLTYIIKLFPTLYNPLSANIGDVLHSLTLPIVALALGPIATITRYLRGELIENLNAEYLLLARTKGLTRTQAVIRHAFRNSCVPLANIIVPMFTGILGGSLVIESIFGIPGMGGSLMKSINSGDHPLTIALLIIYSAISLVTILIMDISYGLLDPRIRIGGKNS